MKIFVLILIGAVSLSAQSPSVINDLKWFAGNWEMIKGDRRTEEFWLSPSGNILLGVSRTVKSEMLVEHEFMSIEQDSIGDIYYRAKPSRQPDASFKLLSVDSSAVVFENREHDFPQRIIYRRLSNDSLIARIEGVIKGTVRGIDYGYRKIKN